jgi:hypothetical protein
MLLFPVLDWMMNTRQRLDFHRVDWNVAPADSFIGTKLWLQSTHNSHETYEEKRK